MPPLAKLFTGIAKSDITIIVGTNYAKPFKAYQPILAQCDVVPQALPADEVQAATVLDIVVNHCFQT